MLLIRRAAIASSILLAAAVARGEERTERFDNDPGWEARNNRTAQESPTEVKQDFGYSATNHAGGRLGEIGGFVSPAGETAYYATKIASATFDTPLTASGTMACDDGPFHVLVGFFNSNAVNEWRTPSSISLRINGRGDVFYAYVEYCSSRWRAGGDHPQAFPMTRNPETGRGEPIGFAAKGAVHRWSLRYDPAANGVAGAVIAKVDDATAICNLEPEHRQDGAKFDRFGLMTVMKSADTGGSIWLDDVEVNDERHDFARDPGWEGVGNRRTYTGAIKRPRFDFGFSATNFSGGQKSGEIGGLVFRGDCRYPESMAYYADRLDNLTLEKPFEAGGKVALKRGVSDSSVLIGFFNAQDSTLANPSQSDGLPKQFLGISTDGPSRDGFFFAPTYRIDGGAQNARPDEKPPQIYPDGVAHDWKLVYTPSANGGGKLRLTLDGQSIELPVDEDSRKSGARFDRFGIITTWIDGNSQNIYFDDLTYTAGQD